MTTRLKCSFHFRLAKQLDAVSVREYLRSLCYFRSNADILEMK